GGATAGARGSGGGHDDEWAIAQAGQGRGLLKGCSQGTDLIARPANDRRGRLVGGQYEKGRQETDASERGGQRRDGLEHRVDARVLGRRRERVGWLGVEQDHARDLV